MKSRETLSESLSRLKHIIVEAEQPLDEIYNRDRSLDLESIPVIDPFTKKVVEPKVVSMGELFDFSKLSLVRGKDAPSRLEYLAKRRWSGGYDQPGPSVHSKVDDKTQKGGDTNIAKGSVTSKGKEAMFKKTGLYAWFHPKFGYFYIGISAGPGTDTNKSYVKGDVQDRTISHLMGMGNAYNDVAMVDGLEAAWRLFRTVYNKDPDDSSWMKSKVDEKRLGALAECNLLIWEIPKPQNISKPEFKKSLESIESKAIHAHTPMANSQGNFISGRALKFIDKLISLLKVPSINFQQTDDVLDDLLNELKVVRHSFDIYNLDKEKVGHGAGDRLKRLKSNWQNVKDAYGSFQSDYDRLNQGDTKVTVQSLIKNLEILKDLLK